jgi:hypothetical protein
MTAQPALIVVEVEVGSLAPTKAKEYIDAVKKELEPKLPDGIPSIFVSAKNGIPAVKVSTLYM